MASRSTLKTRVGKILARKLREHFRNGAVVRVEKSDYRDYLHVYVTSSKFQGMTPDDRAAKVWRWLEEDLTSAEQAKVTLLLTLTPREERQLLGAGR